MMNYLHVLLIGLLLQTCLAFQNDAILQLEKEGFIQIKPKEAKELVNTLGKPAIIAYLLKDCPHCQNFAKLLPEVKRLVDVGDA